MTAINLDDELVIEEHPWRARAITLGVLAVIAAAIIGAILYFRQEDSVSVARETEEIAVVRGAINQRLSVTGVAEAQLSSNLAFQSSGTISSVNVRVGDIVSSGQVLASLESRELQNAVDVAQANVTAAQLKLDDLLTAADLDEVAAAEQSVAQAQAALTKAENDYNDLADGVTASEMSAAQQGVTAAQSQLATAQSARQKLDDAPTAADISAAEAAVRSAESALTAAQNSRASAQNSVTTASASLKAAEASYCAADGAPAFCGTPAAPISAGDATLIDAALGGANATLASGVIAANGAYLNAQNSLNSATAAVTSAENALDSAEAKLAQLEDGPTASEVAAADAAVTSAQAGLTAAQDKLAQAQQGATSYQLSTAGSAVDSARAALTAAEARRDVVYRGADSNAISQARQAVVTARLQAEAAAIRLEDTQIIAPFDGTIGAVNIKVGEFAGSALGAAGDAAAPIVLLTPDRMTLKMSVGETDYRAVNRGQGGAAIFDGIPGAPYPFTITEIGLSPTITQGVVTYEMVADLVVLPGNPPPAPGMNARGQLTTETKENIIIVPPRAIRLRGTDQVVDVKRESGIEEQVVTTGARDNENVEILTGLNEGDVVVVVSLTSAEPTPAARPTLPGGIR